MKRLTELTAAQRAAMAVHARSWIDRALEVRPADRERAERGIRGYYRVARLPEPRAIVWTTSPLAVALAGPIAAWCLALLRRSGAVHRVAVHGAVHHAVDGAVGD